VLLSLSLLLARTGTSLAQGNCAIIAGQSSLVVLLPGQSNASPANCGLIVAAPGSILVMQSDPPRTAVAQAKATKTPVAILMRADYNSANAHQEPGKRVRANWQTGSLVGFDGSIKWKGKQTIANLILVTFDDFAQPDKPDNKLGKIATITYTSDDGKRAYTVRRQLDEVIAEWIFSDGEGTSEPLSYEDVKAISFKLSAATASLTQGDAAMAQLAVAPR
jgi:hypothetical protein